MRLAYIHKNKIQNLLLLWLLTGLGALLYGQDLSFSGQDLDALMRMREEYYFSVKVSDFNEIQELNHLVSVDQVRDSEVVCYADPEQYQLLLSKGYSPTLLTPPSMLEEAGMYDGRSRAGYEWDAYPTYEAYESMMEEYASTHPDRCTLMTLGTLESGRKIMLVRLNNGVTEGKPKFLYTSTMHGDETTGYILMLRLIDHLLTSTSSEVQCLMDSLDIFICPNANPDGTYYGGNHTVNGARRYNANRVDLNRNYKDFDDGDHPDGKDYALETQWFMQLAYDYPFTMGANYHGGAEVANYPWDTYQPIHPDDAWWRYVSQQYATTVKQHNSSYFCNPSSSGITNGYAWYTITGSRQDFMNYFAECRELTIECSNTKCPNASNLPTYWTYNKEALLQYMREALRGIHGVVRDTFTGETIPGASIVIENHDAFGSDVSSHSAGDFHRPIKGGTYTLTVSKEGYQPYTQSVTIADGQRLDLDIELMPSNLQQATYHLTNGWNWWVPTLDLGEDHALQTLEQALGNRASVIKSQNDGVAYYTEATGWVGSLQNLHLNQMYMIETNQNLDLTLTGLPFDPETLDITLLPGWNWMVSPVSQNTSINEALTPFEPQPGDIIKSYRRFAIYIEGYGWFGTLTTLKPGEGYMYHSNTDDK